MRSVVFVESESDNNRLWVGTVLLVVSFLFSVCTYACSVVHCWPRYASLVKEGEMSLPSLVSSSRDGTIVVWNTDTRSVQVLQSNCGGYVWGVVAAAGRNCLATFGQDEKVRLWDPADLTCTLVLPGDTKGVCSIAFSPNAGLLATGHTTGIVRLWDMDNREWKWALQEHRKGMVHVSFSPSGRVFATGGQDGMLALWDVDTRSRIAAAAGLGFNCVVFSPDGRMLVTGGRAHSVDLWHADSLVPAGSLAGHTRPVICAAFSPDGLLLATGSADRTVRLWDVTAQRSTALLDAHEGWVLRLAFSPSGTTLASCSNDMTVRLWSMRDAPCCVAVLAQHTDTVTAVAFLPSHHVRTPGCSVVVFSRRVPGVDPRAAHDVCGAGCVGRGADGDAWGMGRAPPAAACPRAAAYDAHESA
jgi:WD40 repeat protein